MSITAAAVLKAAGPVLGRQAGAILARLADERTWRVKAAAKALRAAPRPWPLRPLAGWLKSPEVHRDFVLAPRLPETAAGEIAGVLARNRRWARLEAGERTARSVTVAAALYAAVISEQRPALASQMLSVREAVHDDLQAARLAQVAASQLRAEASQEAAAARGDRASLDDRLTRLPPTARDEVLRAWDEDPARSWRLADALGHRDNEPLDVAASWQAAEPDWLAGAGPAVLIAAAVLASAYDATGLYRALLLRAARGGAPGRQILAARAALTFAGDQKEEALAALDVAGTPRESPLPFVRAVDALVDEDWPRVAAALDAWRPADDRERFYRWAVADRAMFLSAPDGALTTDLIARALPETALLLQQSWHDSAALPHASRLTMASAMRTSARPHADLREAAAVALKVRDRRRAWRGDTGPAVAAACDAMLHAERPKETVRLGTVDGEATPREAAHPDVAAKVGVALAMLGGDLSGVDLAALPEHRREVVLAQAARARGEDDEPHWRAALAAADSEPETATALGGLASTGTLDLPGMDAFEAEHPSVAALMRATGEIKRGDHAAAVARLRGRDRDDAQAAALLAQAYEMSGETEAAVETLRRAEATFTDPDLGWTAVLVLHKAGRTPEAAAEATRVLTSASDAWPGRARALAFAAMAAAEAGDLSKAAELLASCVELDPADPHRRWDLVRLHLARADAVSGWRVFGAHPVPLEPRDPQEARAWLQLHHAYGTAAVLAKGAVRLTALFPDDETVATTAVAVVLVPRSGDDPLDEPLRADVQAMVAGYVERWPEGAIRAITVDTDDPDALLARLAEMARVDPETSRLRRQIHGQVARSVLPLGALAAAARLPHSELVVLRGLGLLPSVHPDPAEQARSSADAAAALGGACMAETTALAALLTLPDEDADLLVRAFRVVETTDETLADARNGRDRLAGRSTLSVAWDPDTGRPLAQETTEEEADRLAEQAETLLRLVERQPRRQSSRPADAPAREADDHRYGPWLPTVETAAAAGRALWSDDATLRALARALGAPAFGTAALVDALVDAGTVTPGRRDVLLQALVRGRVGVPLTAPLLLAAAEAEAWRPDAAAAALGDPAIWATPGTALRLLGAVLPRVVEELPDAVPAWLHRCGRGIGYSHTHPLRAAEIAGVLLAAAVQMAATGPERVPDLVEAVRIGLRNAAPDPDFVPDPLYGAARVLLGALPDGTGLQEADQVLRQLFSALDEDDQETVASLLTPA